MSVVPDYLRVIRLGYGEGQPGKQACWMTALQSHIGGRWADKCDCVDPVINEYCICINDSYGNDNEGRTEDILEFGLFRPLGTAGDTDATMRRMWHVVDVTIRRIVPVAYDACGMAERAESLRSLDRIADRHSANAAMDAADAANAASRVAASAASRAAAYAAACSINAAAYAAANSAHRAANYSANATTNAANASGSRREFMREHCYPLLAELIEMGPHGPTEVGLPVCGIEEFHRLVGVKG